MCPVWLFVLLINSDCLCLCASGGLAPRRARPFTAQRSGKTCPISELPVGRAGAAGIFPQHWPHPPAVTLDSS